MSDLSGPSFSGRALSPKEVFTMSHTAEIISVGTELLGSIANAPRAL